MALIVLRDHRNFDPLEPGHAFSLDVGAIEEQVISTSPFLENATVRGRVWYKLLDAPVLTLDVTV